MSKKRCPASARDGEARLVRPHRGVYAGVVDVVCDSHQRSGAIARIDPSSSIGDHEIADAQQAQHARRKGHLADRVALVRMHAALHHCHRNSPDRPEDQVPGVSHHRRLRKVRYVRVRDRRRVLDLFAKAPQTGSQDHSHRGLERRAAPDISDGGLRLLKSGCHQIDLTEMPRTRTPSLRRKQDLHRQRPRRITGSMITRLVSERARQRVLAGTRLNR